ncbi:MAG: hypothetical protein U5K81_02035 [Trueperaceae bacterium]|nr:hypothetical protein [Trueperaceae bacterium]
MNVEVTGDVDNGTYSCEVTVTNPETGETDTTTVEIVVQQFSLGTDQLSVTYEEGQTASDALDIERDDDMAFEVAIDVTCEQGVTVDPSSTTLTGMGTSTYTFDVSGGNGGSSYTCSIEASTQDGDGNTLDTEAATLSIVVEEVPTTPECELASFTYVGGQGPDGNVWYYDEEPAARRSCRAP